MALADFLQALLRQPQGPQNMLADAASAQGSAGPNGSAAYQNALQAAFRQRQQPQAASAPQNPYMAGNPTGLLSSGNIDLYHRPVVQNPDGSISTVRSMSFGEDGKEILVPTVSPDGKILSDDQAIDLYHKTGKNLGVFDNPADATAYAKSLHNQQAGLYARPQRAPQATPASNGGGIGSFLEGIINPQARGRNMTIQYLTQKGYDPGTATLIAGDKPLLRQVLIGGKGKNEFDQRAAAAKQYGLDISSPEGRDFVLTGKMPGADGGNVSYGQTPLMLTDPQNKMHMGQMSNGGGILIDGKTYSSLPDGWKVGTVSQSGSGGLSPEALDIISTQYLAGDKSAIQGFSRNATMRAQLANAIAAKADSMGMDGKAIAAEVSAYGGNVAAQRAAGTRSAQVGMAASEANQMADIALEASQDVPRGALRPWNALTNAVRTGTSSPQMAAFVTATTSLVNAYARAVSPLGAPTDAMRQHAEQMLNTAQSPEAYEAVINQMKKEMVAALSAPSEISNQLKGQVTGANSETTSPTGQKPSQEDSGGTTGAGAGSADLSAMPAPQGVDPNVWKFVPPEKRRLWAQ